MRSALPVAAVAGVLALAGCSQGGKNSAGPEAASSAGGASATAAAARGVLTIPQDVDEETKKQYVYQNALAACMRGEGLHLHPARG